MSQRLPWRDRAGKTPPSQHSSRSSKCRWNSPSGLHALPSIRHTLSPSPRGAYKLIALPPASSHATHYRTFNITSHRVTSQRCGHVHQQYGCRTTCAPGRFPSSACAPADNPPNAARLTIRSAPSTSTCRTDRHTATTASAPVQNTPWAHTPNPTQSLSTCQPEMCRFHNENGGFRPIVRN